MLVESGMWCSRAPGRIGIGTAPGSVAPGACVCAVSCCLWINTRPCSLIIRCLALYRVWTFKLHSRFWVWPTTGFVHSYLTPNRSDELCPARMSGTMQPVAGDNLKSLLLNGMSLSGTIKTDSCNSNLVNCTKPVLETLGLHDNYLTGEVMLYVSQQLDSEQLAQAPRILYITRLAWKHSWSHPIGYHAKLPILLQLRCLGREIGQTHLLKLWN